MFQRKITVAYATEGSTPKPCPIKWLDNFAMRNFSNYAVFDDTLSIADGVLEIGSRVPLDHLASAMEGRFRRKGYLQKHEGLRITEQ